MCLDLLYERTQIINGASYAISWAMSKSLESKDGKAARVQAQEWATAQQGLLLDNT